MEPLKRIDSFVEGSFLREAGVMLVILSLGISLMWGASATIDFKVSSPRPSIIQKDDLAPHPSSMKIWEVQ